MIALIKQLVFGDKCLQHDHSNPLLTFQFPNILHLEGTYAILRPRLLFWIQIATLIFAQAVIAISLATVIYKFIIKQRGSSLSFLIGWGFVVPFAVAFPFYAIPYFDVQNRAVLVAVAATPTLIGFRCLEALYGFSPPAVEDSLWHYCIYYSSVIEFVFDDKTRLPAVASKGEVYGKGKTFAINFVVSCLLLSFMEAFDYRPFQYDIEDNGGMHCFSRFIHPGHIANNFLSAVSTSLTISTGTVAFGFGICALFGIRTLDVFDNPMFGSTSVSDFWGRRWNRLVHGVLKRGVYKPVRKQSNSKTIAALAAFIASGALHEYILVLLSLPVLVDGGASSKYSTFTPVYGKQFCFFAWNGMLMVLEYIALQFSMPKALNIPKLPNILRSLLVVLMALPVAHWFTDEYVKSGIFSHFVVGFPMIVKLN
mmetsp:Transcript_5815/g.11388  ORF Transcript_5815/g.11388 Transcript_5815/m.11388 type:complete len:424 (+) Transcript_5815:32-1303(+)|eukprot:CAMPEP_0171433170 /NCGR_PEP_ID=MMETSP0881-20121228/8356_1 /TAXON_ID=67004 /ORGANISM="Thalassiosira weissflogii, Strain CCMP1336" /LENGTH=423 /DNA_ID=CAMNT_0011953715 /DNA_START=33 /DNA_END=1304 /DNA_ORIENTATION=-